MSIVELLGPCLALALGALGTGCGGGAPDPDYRPTYAAQPPGSERVYLFGVHPLHNPKRLFEVYQPLVDYLNGHLEEARLQLEASRNYAAFDEKLYAGRFDFALPNPYQTVRAVERAGYRVFGKMGDDDQFRGILLVRRDSGIREVADLKGKAVAYPAPTALAATMLPQWYLHSHGLDLKRDLEHRYVGSQESAIMNVYLGRVAAGATWPPPWRAFARERPEVAAALTVQWQTEPLQNNGLVAHPRVPEALMDRVGELLFGLHRHDQGRSLLAALDLSRFEPADEASYWPVEDFLARFAREVRPLEQAP